MLARPTPVNSHRKPLHQVPFGDSRVVLVCASATTAELTTEPAFATPIVPSKRPVRSRRLQPQLTDPEDVSQYILFYPRWCLSSQLCSQELLGPGGEDVRPPLPSAYCGAGISNITNDIETHSTVCNEQRIASSGGYLADGNANVTAQLLIASSRKHTLREMLGLSSTYEDDFFRGPDYRYSVDDQGRILDMVHIKRHRVPAPYQRATTSILSTAAERLNGTDIMTSITPSNQADQIRDRLEYSDTDVQEDQEDEGQYDFLGRDVLSEKQVQQNTSRKHAVSSKARHLQTNTQQPSTTEDIDVQHPNTPLPSSLSIGMLIDISSVIHSQQSSLEQEIEHRTLPELSNKSSQAPEEQGSSRHEGGADDTQLHSPGVKPKAGGQFLSTSDAPILESQGTSTQPELPVLRAYVYCIGSKELFEGLWDLDLLDKLLFTDNLDEADLILHKRPKPGEKQFAFNRLRDSAKERGIPFVSVRDGSVQELRDYLMPVYKLYMGQLSPQSLVRQYGPKAGGKHKKRIRL